LKADLVDVMGSDLTVVNSARVSFQKESFEVDDKDEGLIKYLAKHNHWTPFSHPMIQMRETVPIFVARQRFKHMVGFSYNEVSRRYVDDTPEFYTPEQWRGRPEGSLKQGSSELLLEDFTCRFSGKVAIKDRYERYIGVVIQFYEDLISSGVSPEQARMVLPQSMLTSYYVTGSLAAWARAYKQRVDSHAQLEIQDLGRQWGRIIQPLFPKSWDALTK
jgi:thymidylate synthase (FAD)